MPKPPKLPEGRQLSRHETHDLGMIIKDRAKVLKAHVTYQAAACLADFEEQIAQQYDWDDDEVWKKAMEDFKAAAQIAQTAIEEQARKRGIPAAFAPSIGFVWQGRGQNAVKERRQELRMAAKARIDAMAREAEMQVEREALDLRTQVVSMGLLSPAATLFLTTMTTVEQAMPRLQINTVKKQIEDRAQRQQKITSQFH